MKTLLFVQNGDARPKCCGEAWAENPNGARPYEIADGGGLEWFVTFKQFDATVRNRWWLVECYNADAGRMVIQCEHPTKECAYRCCDRGRVLVSGCGKAKP